MAEEMKICPNGFMILPLDKKLEALAACMYDSQKVRLVEPAWEDAMGHILDLAAYVYERLTNDLQIDFTYEEAMESYGRVVAPIDPPTGES